MYATLLLDFSYARPHVRNSPVSGFDTDGNFSRSPLSTVRLVSLIFYLHGRPYKSQSNVQDVRLMTWFNRQWSAYMQDIVRLYNIVLTWLEGRSQNRGSLIFGSLLLSAIFCLLILDSFWPAACTLCTLWFLRLYMVQIRVTPLSAPSTNQDVWLPTSWQSWPRCHHCHLLWFHC